MLDPRVYRAAFAPFLLALVVAAFALVDLPRPIQTTLAPDAFDGDRAFRVLGDLTQRFGDRRPGSPGDERLAATVAGAMRSTFCPGGRACGAVRVHRRSERTVVGRRTLTTVVATRVGQPGPGIVVLAHRDAAGGPAEAELSATAGLIELARVFDGHRTRRTLTLVSTSGGSGGAAGAAEAAGLLPRPVDAVLVLGDLASQGVRKPWVLPWSDAPRLAPVRLRRTVEAAVRIETGQDPGGPRAAEQAARLAFPFALTEEGPLNADGLPAVALQVSGQRGPSAGAPVAAERLRVFGRAALRTVDALDNGPDLAAAPSAEIVTQRKVLPPWTVRLLVGVLLLPALLAAVDGVARARRRRAPVGLWLRWVAGLAVPFVAAAVLARVLGLSGLLGEASGGAVPGGRVPTDAVALAVVALVFVLGWLLVGALHRALGVRGAPEGGTPVVALGIVVAVLAAAVWLRNPFAAAVLLLPAHLWLVVPELRLPRAAALALAALALVPAALVLAVYASALGLAPAQVPWSLLLLVAGGHVGLLALLCLCALGACGVAAARLALRDPGHDAPPLPAVSVRGPAGYAGPGSLGGTGSALRPRR